ncbi:MAG: uroporphyrinogen decarboxylase [Planctomycetes bacterium]|nr:uroporphyrinogen decarboxylase [Planctomycetota bacterium]
MPHCPPALADSAFLRACRGEPAPYTPIWLMRQAGRYMKEYRDIRAKVSMLDLCKTPALAAEVTVTAANRLGVDAAIIFSDLLLILQPMDLELEFLKGDGPVIRNPIRVEEDVRRLRSFSPAEDLGYVYEAVRLARASLPGHIPLIGFAGAPFTLASYMIEGRASRNYEFTKAFMLRSPAAWHALMDALHRPVAEYLNGQIAAGAQAVQLFDSWVGCLSPSAYRQYVLPTVHQILSEVTPGVPVIHFGTGNPALLEAMKEAGGDVIGLDYRVELDEAWQRLGRVGVQGNLDPCVLLADRPAVLREAGRILDQAGGRPGHIFNLGHGILPETPVDNVVALVDFVHERSGRR